MRKISTVLWMAAVVGLVAGCSGGGGSQLFNGNCNTCAPQPVAQNPCAPPCDPQPACEPCAPVTDPTVQGQRPPDARAGEVWCYVRVPAVTRQVEERVCVRPESCRTECIPAEYETQYDTVVVEPARVDRIPIPAEYEDRCEQICVAPARTEWARVDCEPTQLAEKEQVGECWTLKEIPPQYETRTTRVCVKPAGCREVQVPAVTKQVARQVCIKPESTRRIPIPAEYETRYREEIVCGPRWEWRRTTECEVPEVTGGGAAPMDMAPMGDNTLPPVQDTAPVGAQPEAVGSPDDNVPPAGGLPPLR